MTDEPAPPVPTAVVRITNGQPLTLAWANEVGGLTYAFDGPTGDARFVKWNPVGNSIDLADEIARLRWVGRYTTVPRVLDRGTDDDGGWFVTRAIAGTNAVSERWKQVPDVAVRALGRGLREMHDALPAEECPFSWSAADRLADILDRANIAEIDPLSWSDEHRHLSIGAALAILADPPPTDRLLVCHGDPCSPNTVLADDGSVAGHVDLGSLGLADRWADLAVATWSTIWNYGPGWEGALLDAYGIEPDEERTRYYRLLWDLG